MFPELEELKLKKSINLSTKVILEEIKKNMNVKDFKLANENIDKFVDELVKSINGMNSFVKKDWEGFLKEPLTSTDNLLGKKKFILDNVGIFKDTFKKSIEKLNKIRYNRIERFRISLNKEFGTNFKESNFSEKSSNWIEEQLKRSTRFNFKEEQTVRKDIKNMHKFSSSDLEMLEKYFYRRNELWARDQTGDLYAMTCEEIAMDNNIETFRWVTEEDDRVRETHKVRNQKLYKFDSVDYLPGQQVLCRCHMIPLKKK